MIKLHFLWLCWGPMLFCFSLSWLVMHPSDWTGPAVIAPLSALYGFASYGYAFRMLNRGTAHRFPLIAAMIAGPVLGVMVGIVLVTGAMG